MIEKDVTILGAGWAGLLSGLKFNERDKKLRFLDKDKELGGLLKTESIQGFTFDTGGPHLLFSRDTKILNDITSILGANVLSMKRNNYIFLNGKFIHYPFENGIYELPPSDRINIIKGIIKKMIENSSKRDWKPQNFEEWANGVFGDEMASQYIIPYNKKIWKRPLQKMAADWTFTPGRLPYPELSSLLDAAAGLENVGYKEQATFFYPKHGGIGSLYQFLYFMLKKMGSDFNCGVKVNSIERTSSGKYLVNSNFISSSVVNTIPLPEAIVAVDKSPSTLKLAKKFDWNNVVVVGIAISKRTPDQTAIYVPDEKIIFHRYTWMSSLIIPKDNVHSNLIAEVTIPKGKPIDEEQIRNKVIKDLASIEVIKDENEILFSKVWFNNYGYPIYTLDHNEVRKNAIDILSNLGIKSVGRWGSWHYWNTDMVYKAVNELELV